MISYDHQLAERVPMLDLPAGHGPAGIDANLVQEHCAMTFALHIDPSCCTMMTSEYVRAFPSPVQTAAALAIALLSAASAVMPCPMTKKKPPGPAIALAAAKERNKPTVLIVVFLM
jgi:hypothetical protein